MVTIGLIVIGLIGQSVITLLPLSVHPNSTYHNTSFFTTVICLQAIILWASGLVHRTLDLTESMSHCINDVWTWMSTTTISVDVVVTCPLSTVGDPDTSSGDWKSLNDLPSNVTSTPSLPVFCNCLKIHLFMCAFPWLLLCMWSD